MDQKPPSFANPTQNWVLIGFGTALLALAIMAGVTVYRTQMVEKALTKSMQADNFRKAMLELMADLYRAESSVREYVLYQQPRSFGDLHIGSEIYRKRIDQMEEMAQEMDDPGIMQQVDRLHTYLGVKYGVMRELSKLAGAQAQLKRVYDSLADSTASLELFDIHADLDSGSALGEYYMPLDTIGLRFLEEEWILNYEQRIESAQRVQQAQERIEQELADNLITDRNSREQIQNVVFSLKERLDQKTKDIGEMKNDIENTFPFIMFFGASVILMELAFLGFIINNLDKNRRLQEQLQQEKDRAEDLARVKEEFLANMSHEIRTPMNAVIGFADQLDHTPMQPEQRRLLDPLRHSAGFLLALINDILDYSKLESGSFPLEQIGYNPQEVLQEVHDTFAHQADKKALQLICEAKSELPEVLIGDPLRLKQMLFNLVGNALKFTEQGSVTLSLSGRVSGEGNLAHLTFEVQDTGIGIPAEKQATIFSKFIQADTSTTRRYGGTGLGLAITQRLADLQSGHISLTSEVGRGTTVRLELPQRIGKASDLAATMEPIRQDASRLAGRRVLLVDDELYNRELAQYILDRWQMAVTPAENGEVALAHLREDPPYDVVLMDLQMPVLDGYATARRIRQELQFTELPILAMTATSTPQEIQRARDEGMNAHLLKPFRESELLNQLLRLLPGEDPRAEPRVVSPRPEPPVPAVQDQASGTTLWGYSREAARHWFNQDHAFMQRMLGIFLKQTPPQLEELETAFQAHDWDTVAQRAHTLLPRCRNLGLQVIVDDLKFIETEAQAGRPVDPSKLQRVSTRLREVVARVEQDVDWLKHKGGEP